MDTEFILGETDAVTARLQHSHAPLSGMGKTATKAATLTNKRAKRRLSPQARKRIAEA